MSVTAARFSESGFLVVAMELLSSELVDSGKTDEEILESVNIRLRKTGCDTNQQTEFASRFKIFLVGARCKASVESIQKGAQ